LAKLQQSPIKKRVSLTCPAGVGGCCWSDQIHVHLLQRNSCSIPFTQTCIETWTNRMSVRMLEKWQQEKVESQEAHLETVRQNHWKQESQLSQWTLRSRTVIQCHYSRW